CSPRTARRSALPQRLAQGVEVGLDLPAELCLHVRALARRIARQGRHRASGGPLVAMPLTEIKIDERCDTRLVALGQALTQCLAALGERQIERLGHQLVAR